MVNKLILLKGNINYVSKSQTRITESVHFCEKTGQFIQKIYFDNFKLTGMKEQTQTNTNEIPIKDHDGNPISFEHGLSHFNDFQIAGVQESTENVPTGMLSRTIEVYL
jgi:DNA replication licensing factor MCM3